MRSRKSCLTNGANPVQATECQTSILRRTIWDGDQVLAEIQMPGGDQASDTTYWEKDTNVVSLPALHFTGLGDPSRYFGRVIYAHGAGIDHPVFVTRYNFVRAVNDTGQEITPPYVIPYARFMPFWNTLGDATLGAFSNGEQTFCPGSIGRCEGVFWPYTFSAWNREHGTVGRNNWQGSLLENGQDKSGLQFRRNRYYDPQTGRFTQEDPIGLAGGLNLYGFANGDPVNFSDPFGLCKEKKLSDVFRCVAWRLKKFQKGVEIAWGVESAVLPLGEETAVITSLELGGGRAASGMGSARALGEAGEAAAGIVKNTERIPSATGTAAFRVPDGLTATTLTEVKNVARLGLTNQLRDFAAFAKATGREFDLVVRSTTELSKPLQDFIRTEGINVRFLP